MRPLKRPMFKYGGDVKKQGIMHGMNGLRDGGVATTMADATGYAGGGMTMPNMRGRVTGPGGYAGKKLSAMDKLKYAGSGYLGTEGALGIVDLMRYLFNDGGKVGAGLVGDPRYPQQGGRAMHNQYLFPETGTSSAMPRTKLNIKSIKDVPKTPGQAKKKIIGGVAKKLFPNTNFEGIGARGLGYLKNFYDKRISLPKFRRPGFQKQGPLYKVPAMERAGNFIRNNKLLTGAGLVYGTPAAVGTAKFAIDKGPAIVKGILDPSGFYRDQYGKVKKALGFEDKKVPPPGEGGPGGVPDAVINPPETKAEIEAKAKALEDKKLKRIYSLLGVDRAKRGAASKALADMSRYIDEGGKDTISRKNIGSTLTKGILAFDKRLDKVDQLKEAAGLMLAKGEIAEMGDPLGKEAKRLSIKVNKEKLNPGVETMLMAAEQNAKGGTVSEAKISEAVRRGALNEGKELIEYISSDDIDDGNLSGSVTEIVGKLENIKPGYYQVGKSVVLVDDDLSLTLRSGPATI